MLHSSSQRFAPSSTIVVGNAVIPWVSCRYLVGKRTCYKVEIASDPIKQGPTYKKKRPDPIEDLMQL